MNMDLATSDPEDRLEAISAFVDGEWVDPDALRSALALEEGRDYLVDLLKLRAAVAAADPPAATAILPRRQLRGLLRPMAAAAIAFAALAGGYVAGQRTGTLTPAAPDHTGIPDIVVTSSAPEPPKPTRVIRLEPGRNWTDRAGGY